MSLYGECGISVGYMSITVKKITEAETAKRKVTGLYKFESYWRSSYGLDSGLERFEVVNDSGQQVALFDIDFTHDRLYWQDDWDVLPPEGPVVFEIKYLDVREGYRNQGIGREVVNWLLGEYADCQIVVFSGAADYFWDSLGWNRFDIDPVHWPMYISPLNGESNSA